MPEQTSVASVPAVTLGVSVSVRELPLFGALALRLDSRRSEAIDAAARVFGAALPQPNTWLAYETAEVLWQAHDEWLIVTRDGSQDALAASLHHALAGMHHAIADVSDLRATLELRGARARDVLQKGCAVDLHPRVFAARGCVTAALARVRVTIRQMDPATYQLLVERSYGRYLWDWLADATSEFA